MTTKTPNKVTKRMRRVEERLAQRIGSYLMIKDREERGFHKPGSLNRHKQKG